MRRVITPTERYFSEALSPGLELAGFYPGGKDGPNGEVHFDLPGGQGWTDYVLLGGRDDPFQLLLPDIRLPANQCWPLHWHDCWTVVIVLEGQCLVGDWWMQPEDVLIVEPGLEYGPLLIGPDGCRLFEIFAKAHLGPGGYAPEYRDHPTLQGSQQNFAERTGVNTRNNGRQVQPCDVAGIYKSRLEEGRVWDLGENNDPDRGSMTFTGLSPNQRLEAHHYDDWHILIVWDGSLVPDGRVIGRDEFLVVAPGATVPELQAGENGARLLECARTDRGMTRIRVAG